MVFRWLSSSPLAIPKAPTAIGVIVALKSHNFCTCNLKSLYLVIFSSSFTLMFWSPGTVCRWFCVLSSLYQWLQYLDFRVLLPYVWTAPKVFYICHFLALALVDVRTICLHIQSQICCTGISVRFVQPFSSFIGLQLGQNINWKYGWHCQLSLCRACIAGTRPGDQGHFLLYLFWVLALG